MSFLAPVFLWGLVALVPLVAIYLLRVRPRRKPTNAYFLWQLVLNQKHTSRLFRRLRDVLSLLLLLLAVVAIVLASARPRVAQEDERDLLIVLDTSASMLAKEGFRTRMEEAKERAFGLVEALNGSRRAAIATLSDRLRFVSHFTDSPKALFWALREVEASAVSVDEGAARELATLAGAEDSRHRVLLLTDGANGMSDYPEGVELLKVGSEQGNAAIVAADLSWRPGLRDQAAFYFKVSSSFKEEKNCELVVRHEESKRTKKLIPLTLKPGVNEGTVVEIEGALPGRWTAELDVEDGLAEDNRVAMALNELYPVRVQVQAGKPYFYQRCITSFERSAGLVQLVNDSPDVVVVEGRPAGADKQLIFKPEGDSSWWAEVGGEVEVLAVRARLKEHPLLRHIDLEALSFGGSRRIRPPDGALVLAESEEGVPLVYAATNGERSALVVNADPNEHDFMLSPWFAVLVYDGARLLEGRSDRLRAVYGTGEKIADDDSQFDFSKVTAIDAEGLRSPAVVEGGAVSRPGHYEVRQAGVPQLFGASLLSAEESRLFRGDIAENAEAVAEGWPLALWFLLLALLLTAGESLLYHRRKVG